MTDEATQVEIPEAVTMESLFPSGKMEKQPETTAKAEQSEEPETEEADALAETQDETAEETENIDEPETGIIGDMSLEEFLGLTGVTNEEFYNKIYRTIDGKRVSMSEAWDGRNKLEQANDALLRERSELQKRLESSATAIPNAEISPDAQALMAQAQIYNQQLQQIMQDPNFANDPNAASRKVDLKFAIDNLVGQAQQKQAEWTQGQQEKIRQALDERDRQTRSQIPEWNDATVQATEWRGIADMMASYGIQDTNVQRFNPAERRLLRDAWRAQNQAKRINEGAKRIRKVPKVLPSTSRAPMASKLNKADTQKQASQEIKSAKTRDERLKTMLKVDLG